MPTSSRTTTIGKADTAIGDVQKARCPHALMAKEHVPRPQAESAPSYAAISRGLTTFLAETGNPPREGFPKGNQWSEYDHRAEQIVLHPWTPPRVRATILLDEAIRRCERLESAQRSTEHGGGEDDDEGIIWYEGDDASWRPDVIGWTVAHRLGMTPEPPEDDALETGEEAAVERILEAVFRDARR
jgi:hypothetical protein